MRKACRLLLATAMAALSFGAVASSANAASYIINGGHDFTYNGCEAHAEADDLYPGSKAGYAEYVITKGQNVKMPSGCTWNIYTDYDYWDGVTNRHGEAVYRYVERSSTPIWSVYGNVRVTGMTATLCRTVGTLFSCKTFVGTRFN